MTTILAADTFNRTVTSGWGSSDTGAIPYSVSAVGGTVSGTDTSVSTHLGRHSVPAANAFRENYLNVGSFSAVNVDVTCAGSVSFTGTVAGGRIEMLGVLLRGHNNISGTSFVYYLARIHLETDGTMTLALYAPDNNTRIAQVTNLFNAATYVSGTSYSMRYQAYGPWQRIRVWKTTDPEPSTWQIWLADDTYIGAGTVGFRTGVSGGNTTAKPITAAWSTMTVQTIDLPSFTDGSNPVTTEIAWGADLTQPSTTWTFTDVSSDPRWNPGFAISRGALDEQLPTTLPPPSQMSCVMLNQDGSYSRDFPTGPNYPYVIANVPIRQSIGPMIRFAGFIQGYNPQWDSTGKLSLAGVTAKGVLQRFTGPSQPPLRSALYRSISADPATIAYWPAERGDGQIVLQQVIPNRAAILHASSGLLWSNVDGFDGTDTLPQLNSPTDAMYGTLRYQFTNHQWQFDWYYVFPAVPSARTVLMNIRADGAARLYQIIFDSDSSITISALNAFGTTMSTQAFVTSLPFGAPMHMRLSVKDDGTTTTWILVWFPVSGQVGEFGTSTHAGLAGNFTGFGVPPAATMQGVTVGHFHVMNAYDYQGVDAAARGWAGESASSRLVRLAAEEGIELTVRGTSDVAMGPQLIASAAANFTDVMISDKGFMYDGETFALSYVCRSHLYNQTAQLTLDLAAQEATDFTPVDDFQQQTNDWTVSQATGGGVAQYSRADGDKGTDAIGDVPQTQTNNLNVSSDLLQHAAWLVNLGTFPGYRYPTVGFDNRRTQMAAKIPAWLGVLPMSRVDVANVNQVFTQHPPGTVALLCHGWTEQIRPTWAVTANTVPESPYEIARYGVTGVKYDSATSTLVSAVNSTATSFQVVVGDGNEWTTDPTQFPFDLRVGGERMTVSAIASSITDSFTRTTSSGWGTPTTTPGPVWTVAAGVTASVMSTNGTRALMTPPSLAPYDPVMLIDTGSTTWDVKIRVVGRAAPVGGPTFDGLIAGYQNANNLYYVYAKSDVTTGAMTATIALWQSAALTVLAAVSITPTLVSGDVFIRASMNASGLISLKVWQASGAEPYSWTTQVTDTTFTSTKVGVWGAHNGSSPTTHTFDDFAVLNPQTFTVTRSINGISKAQTAATKVSLFTPAKYAL